MIQTNIHAIVIHANIQCIVIPINGADLVTMAVWL